MSVLLGTGLIMAQLWPHCKGGGQMALMLLKGPLLWRSELPVACLRHESLGYAHGEDPQGLVQLSCGAAPATAGTFPQRRCFFSSLFFRDMEVWCCAGLLDTDMCRLYVPLPLGD